MRSRGINLLHVLQGKKEGGGDARGDEWVEKQGDGDGRSNAFTRSGFWS